MVVCIVPGEPSLVVDLVEQLALAAVAAEEVLPHLVRQRGEKGREGGREGGREKGREGGGKGGRQGGREGRAREREGEGE